MVLEFAMKYMVLIMVWLLQSNVCDNTTRFAFSMSITLWIISQLMEELDDTINV
jgi:hypothetical protein